MPERWNSIANTLELFFFCNGLMQERCNSIANTLEFFGVFCDWLVQERCNSFGNALELHPSCTNQLISHDDVNKWKHFPRNWPFVQGIHRSPVNSPHKSQWHRALVFSLICVWINDWVNNREADDLRRYHAHYDIIVMNNSGDGRCVCNHLPCHHWFAWILCVFLIKHRT